jgi:hypothetical protein
MNEPRDPDVRDERDDALAAALAVPPLDEVTRRRLVRTALDAPAPKASRWMSVASVAAALVIGAVVGVVLVDDPTPTDTTTAQRAPSAAADNLESLETVPPAGGEAFVGPITPLGALGDVTDPTDLRAAIDDAFERAAGPTEDSAAVGYPCASNPPAGYGLVATSAVGLGTYEAAPVTILVGTSPQGQAIAVVVRTADCAAVATVPLPNS